MVLFAFDDSHHGHWKHIRCKPKLVVAFTSIGVTWLLLMLAIARLLVFYEQPYEVEDFAALQADVAVHRSNFCARLQSLATNDAGTTVTSDECISLYNEFVKPLAFGNHGALDYTLELNGTAGNLTSTEDFEASWEMWSAFIFCASTVTTVGWGHLTLNTDQGKVIAIVLTIVGLPMSLIIFTVTGVWLKRIVHFVGFQFERCVGIHDSDMEETSKRRPNHYISTISACLVTVGFWFGASFYHQTQDDSDWDFLTAFYFTMITYSTVGYGDVFPNKVVTSAARAWGFLGMLVVGISFTSLFIACLQHAMEQYEDISKAYHDDEDGLALHHTTDATDGVGINKVKDNSTNMANTSFATDA
eukprot:m.77083 g.77083  ORF g.77083 m.77083 type:complete len:359 (+) comp24973_c0_seq4:219-1295(+)